MTNYTVIRSKRKTLAIHIRDGNVEVRAPLKMPQKNIDQFVASKEKWIADKLAESNERTTQRDNFKLDYGDFILYRGKEYPIKEKSGNRVSFDFEDECFYIPSGLTPEHIKLACIQVYRLLAMRYIPKKTFEHAKKMSVEPAVVKLNSAKTRWGSCSSLKSLNFSWMLIMADDDVIDYIIIHELAHFFEMNHSDRFWNIVEREIPDYRERKKKLKELQQRLLVEDWR